MTSWAENLGMLKSTSVESRLYAVELVVYWGPVQLVVELGHVNGQ